MAGDIPRETKGDAREGIPWQIIYASFLGILLCALLFYGGLFLLNAKMGWDAKAGGVAGIALSLALAVSFGALMVGASWAVSVCRISTMAGVAVFLASFSWELFVATGSPEWKLPGAKLWSLALDAIYQPRPLTLLVGLAVCIVILAFLLGSAAKRFFGR